MKTNVLIITNNYPYLPGEEFFEEEIKYWSKNKNTRVIILPLHYRPEKREVPTEIKVLEVKKIRKIEKVLYILLAFFNLTFFKEALFLIKLKSLNAAKLFSLIKSSAKVEIYKVIIKKIIKLERVDVVYSYWNTDASYACADLKHSGYVGAVVSRLHSYDLYEDRSHNNYISLKRQFLPKYDKLFVLSKQAEKYLIEHYRANQENIDIARLGVNIPNVSTHPTEKNTFHLVSVSYCAPVKRIDKIISALVLMAAENQALSIRWTHIGGGELLDELTNIAKKKLFTLSNLEYYFLGTLANKEVQLFYQSNSVDCFVNVSESEGVPVSIMEAMAHGIPSIAPDIGGISELVDNSCGQLMSSRPDICEISNSLKLMVEKSKLGYTRVSARGKVLKLFNSQINYQKTISSILEHVK